MQSVRLEPTKLIFLKEARAHARGDHLPSHRGRLVVISHTGDGYEYYFTFCSLLRGTTLSMTYGINTKTYIFRIFYQQYLFGPIYYQVYVCPPHVIIYTW